MVLLVDFKEQHISYIIVISSWVKLKIIGTKS